MKISTATNQGKRDAQQDYYGICEESIYVVADGHSEGGEIVAKNIVEEIIWNSIEPNEKNILKLFKNLDKQNQFQNCGSTVTAAWRLEKGKFIIAQLGDSQIYWRNKGEVFVSWGHGISNLENDDYYTLLQKGVQFLGPYQRAVRNPNRMLNLSRAIGDLAFEKNVSKIPDIFEIEADAFVISSDGFTGGTEIVKKLLDSGAEASMFIENQKERGIVDNISVIVCYEE